MSDESLKGYGDSMIAASQQKCGAERRAAADAAFADRVHAMACAIMANPNSNPNRMPQGEVAEMAINMVRGIDNEIEDLYEDGGQ